MPPSKKHQIPDKHAVTPLITAHPTRELIPMRPGSSIRWHQHDYPSVYARWNYHPELELHLITESAGTFVVGEHVGRFRPGQLTLIGPNIPHNWVSDLPAEETVRGRDVVLQFSAEWVAQMCATMPELEQLGALLERAARGLEFTGQTAENSALALRRIGRTHGVERASIILTLFELLVNAPKDEWTPLIAGKRMNAIGEQHAQRLNNVMDYIFANFAGNIHLRTAANIANMSESSFSRFFSEACGQAFSVVIRKLRLQRASRLLELSDLTVAAVAHQSGFSNLSHFNRQFLREFGVTPREHRKRIRHEHY